MLSIKHKTEAKTLPATAEQTSGETTTTQLQELKPAENTRLLRERLADLETVERELAADCSKADRVASAAMEEYNKITAAILTDGRNLADGDAAHSALLQALAAKAPIQDRLVRHRGLVARARAMVETSQKAEFEEYRRELTRQHHELAVEFGEALAQVMKCADKFQAVFDRAFQMFPHGGKPECPAPFYSRVKPLSAIIPRPGTLAHGWLLEAERMFGQDGLGPAAQAQLAECNAERQLQLDIEARRNEEDRQRSERLRRPLSGSVELAGVTVVDLRNARARSLGTTFTVGQDDDVRVVAHAPPVNDADRAAALEYGLVQARRQNAEREAAEEAKFPGMRRR